MLVPTRFIPFETEWARVLSRNAAVLKHAFFPGGRKLWPNEKALAACTRALSRLQREDVPLAAQPFGELP